MTGRTHTYNTHLVWTGAAQGATRTYAGYSREHRVDIDGKPSIALSADPLFRGDSALFNPEELLVAALTSCHLLAYLALCARSGIAVASYEDEAIGEMAEQGGGGHFVRVILRPRVVLESGNVERALALHDEAHKQCFIASSVNFPVEHEAQVTQAATV